MTMHNVRYQTWFCDSHGCRARTTPRGHTQAEMNARTPPKGWATIGGIDFCPKHVTAEQPKPKAWVIP